MTACDRLRDRLRRASLLAPCLAAALALAGCDVAETDAASTASGGEASEPVPGELHLEASADLFADASFDGHAEAAAPGVVASIDVEAWGSATVDARVIASASDGGVSLEEMRGGAAIAIEGGLALDGRLVVDLPGVADYDGPIPGLDNQEIRFERSVSIDVLSADAGAARAEITSGNRPGVALPGVDGSLVIAIGEGSFVETTLVAECASADEQVVEIRARLVTSGRLILQPSLEIEAPVLGAQSLALAEVEVTIEGEAAVVLTARVEDLASETSAVQAQLPACS